MNNETKQKIHQRYQHELNRGERFWPDSIFKDVIVSLAIFVLLILLATFVGVESQPKVDPGDTTYIPRPEWYFLFLFKFLALYGQIPLLGKIEWLATVIVPGIAILLLALMPFIDRSPSRYYGKRLLPISVMAIIVVDIVMLTLMADVPTVLSSGSTLPGMLQAVGGLLIPGAAILALFLMSFVFRNTPAKIMIWTAAVSSILTIGLTGAVLAIFSQPAAQTAAVATALVDQISAGQDLYSVNCTECHGEDGRVTQITGVKGLEGKLIPAIHSTDVLYTLDDATLAQVIAYGRPDAGMTPFGKTYGGQLSASDIDNIVIFMRYSWDDRFVAPVLKPLFPPLAKGEVPSYAVHIQPIVKRYCISCHSEGKTNDNFLMDSYDDILHSGDHKADNVIAGNTDSYLLQVIQGHPIADPANPTQTLIRAMPPNGHLPPDAIDVFVRWIMNGMPQSAADAAQLSATATPGTGAAATPAPTPAP
ncbi:MAG TPA: c-type cytochrome [Anaerolineales bacterium]|nr:c-type cytochrome [Anaerolineales bacterium]